MAVVDLDMAWSIEDAVALLHPEMTAAQVRAMIDLGGIRPIGTRPRPGRGRPPAVYDSEQLMKAHAVVARLLVGAY
ncbi:hypothetical protein ACQP2K_30670 [Microbispora siamensis]